MCKIKLLIYECVLFTGIGRIYLRIYKWTCQISDPWGGQVREDSKIKFGIVATDMGGVPVRTGKNGFDKRHSWRHH